jgi:hypothetical protein
VRHLLSPEGLKDDELIDTVHKLGAEVLAHLRGGNVRFNTSLKRKRACHGNALEPISDSFTLTLTRNQILIAQLTTPSRMQSTYLTLYSHSFSLLHTTLMTYLLHDQVLDSFLVGAM